LIGQQSVNLASVMTRYTGVTQIFPPNIIFFNTK